MYVQVHLYVCTAAVNKVNLTHQQIENLIEVENKHQVSPKKHQLYQELIQVKSEFNPLVNKNQISIPKL